MINRRQFFLAITALLTELAFSKNRENIPAISGDRKITVKNGVMSEEQIEKTLDK